MQYYLCKKCGAALQAGHDFCPRCGTRREMFQGVVLCRKCGTKVLPNQNFCPRCGTKREWLQDNDDDVSEEENGNSKGKIIVAVVIALVALLVIGKIVLTSVGRQGIGKFTPADDLKVVGTYVSDGRDLYVVVQNDGKKTVRSYEIAFVEFDSNGNYISRYTDKIYDTAAFSTANILPGDRSDAFNSTFYSGNGGTYGEATIKSITYADGTTWEASGIGTWANKVAKDFSVEKYKQSIENMRENSIKAESTPHAQIISATKYDAGYTNSDNLDIKIKNIGSEDIKAVRCVSLSYDSNGYATSVSPYDMMLINCKGLSFDMAIPTNATLSATSKMYFEKTTSNFKMAVYSVEFASGKVWQNPYIFEWMLYNKDMR